MNIGLLFWVLWVVWLVFNLAVGGGFIHEYALIGGTILYAILFGLLGWQVFGPVVQTIAILIIVFATAALLLWLGLDQVGVQPR